MLVAPLMSSAKGRRCVTSSSTEHASLTLSPLARKRYALVSATIYEHEASALRSTPFLLQHVRCRRVARTARSM